MHPSVRIIQTFAFFGCDSLVRVTIPDTVIRIGESAFCGCVSLTYIRLSTKLEYIGRSAFYNCTSLQAVFLPQTATDIDRDAFGHCTSLRFCNLPETSEIDRRRIFLGCGDQRPTKVSNNLSRVCYSTSVTSQSVQECIDTHGIACATEVNDRQMTALHILCANPHVDGDAIRTYLQ